MHTRKHTHTHTHKSHIGKYTFICRWDDKCVYVLHFLCDLLIDVPDTACAVTVQGATLVVVLPVLISLGFNKLLFSSFSLIDVL